MCTLKNDSVLPTLLEHESEARFSKITFTNDQVLKIPMALDINKAHGHDEISIRMLKLCGKSIIIYTTIRFHQDLNLLLVVYLRGMFVTMIYRLILFDN